MPARAAERWGLANRVVPADRVLDTALELAGTIAANAPLAVRASKRIMARSAAAGSDWDAPAWDMNAEETAAIWTSHDAQEGATAFAEKRKPEWTGT